MDRRACGTAIVVLCCLLAMPAWSEQEYVYSPKAVSSDGQARGKDEILVREVPVQKGDTLSGISRRFSGHGSYYPQILLFNDVKDPNLIYAGTTLRVPLTREKAAAAGETVPAPAVKKGKAGKHKKGKAARVHATTSAPAPVKLPKQQPSADTSSRGAQTGELSISDLKKLDGGREKAQEKRKKVTPVRVPSKAVQHEMKKPLGEEPSTRAADTVNAAAPAAEASGQKLYAQAIKAYRQDDFRAALDLFDRYLSSYPDSPLAADASLYKAECYLKLAGQ